VQVQSPKASARNAVELLGSGTTERPNAFLSRVPISTKASLGAGVEKDRGSAGPVLRSVCAADRTADHISGSSPDHDFARSKTGLLEKFRSTLGRSVGHTTADGICPPGRTAYVLDANVPKQRLASLIALRSGTAPLDPW